MPRGESFPRGIYVVLDAGVTTGLSALLEDVLEAGVRVVQYRAKAGTDRALAERLAARTFDAGGLFVVNDDLALARAIPGAGLHLGREDLETMGAPAVEAAMRGRIVGLSCGTPAEARAAAAWTWVTYLGTGPVAATATKLDAGAAIGASGLAAVCAVAAQPVVAIGGIDVALVPALVRAGAAMAAVVRAVADATDRRLAARRLVRAWHEAEA